MSWFLLFEVIYIAVVILVCIRVIYDTRSTTKTLAYLLLVVFIPLFGIFIYFSFGINYRKRKMYSKKLIEDEKLEKKFKDEVFRSSRQTFAQTGKEVQPYKELAYMLANNSLSALTPNNAVELLINGEEKFPQVIQAMQAAKNHIHIEYYIYEDDEIGRRLEQVMVEKAKEGVTVRFIYDDFGSSSIRNKLVKRLKAAGVQAFPFSKIIFIAFANRLNYRNHRKIIVVDGHTAFVGGINVSDRYINTPGSQNLFWRDTHLQIEGPGVNYLQYLFLCDWNFCAKETLQPNRQFFPHAQLQAKGDKVVQIAASGPDSDMPTILFSLLQAISLSTEELLITTPYFIPGESMLDALMIAAMGGVRVKLLVPGHSDSIVVNAAARSYYDDLLRAGVEVYLYRKGFIHAKTMVIDRKIAVVGTANMDQRSFDLNFEVNAIVYDLEIASKLGRIFDADLTDAEKRDATLWARRPVYKQLLEKAARLISPLL